MGTPNGFYCWGITRHPDRDMYSRHPRPARRGPAAAAPPPGRRPLGRRRPVPAWPWGWWRRPPPSPSALLAWSASIWAGTAAGRFAVSSTGPASFRYRTLEVYLAGRGAAAGRAGRGRPPGPSWPPCGPTVAAEHPSLSRHATDVAWGPLAAEAAAGPVSQATAERHLRAADATDGRCWRPTALAVSAAAGPGCFGWGWAAWALTLAAGLLPWSVRVRRLAARVGRAGGPLPGVHGHRPGGRVRQGRGRQRFFYDQPGVPGAVRDVPSAAPTADVLDPAFVPALRANDRATLAGDRTVGHGGVRAGAERPADVLAEPQVPAHVRRRPAAARRAVHRHHRPEEGPKPTCGPARSGCGWWSGRCRPSCMWSTAGRHRAAGARATGWRPLGRASRGCRGPGKTWVRPAPGRAGGRPTCSGGRWPGRGSAPPPPVAGRWFEVCYGPAAGRPRARSAGWWWWLADVTDRYTQLQLIQPAEPRPAGRPAGAGASWPGTTP